MDQNNILSSNVPIVKSPTTDIIYFFKKHLNFSIFSLIILLIIIIFYILDIVNESKKPENEQNKKIFKQNFIRLITLLSISIIGFLLIVMIHIYTKDNHHSINSRLIAGFIIFITGVMNLSFENNKLKSQRNNEIIGISISLIVISCLWFFWAVFSNTFK